MAQDDLETLLHWLDPAANPRIVQFTRGDVEAGFLTGRLSNRPPH
jgi:hypothetical protein